MTYNEYREFEDRFRRAEGSPQTVDLLREVEAMVERSPEDFWSHILLGFARGYASEWVNC